MHVINVLYLGAVENAMQTWAGNKKTIDDDMRDVHHLVLLVLCPRVSWRREGGAGKQDTKAWRGAALLGEVDGGDSTGLSGYLARRSWYI